MPTQVVVALMVDLLFYSPREHKYLFVEKPIENKVKCSSQHCFSIITNRIDQCITSFLFKGLGVYRQ